MNAILISNDLMVVSRAEGAAAKVGSELRLVPDTSSAINLIRSEGADLVLWDLGIFTAGFEAEVAAIRAAAISPLRVVAFGPHVHEERLAAARAAGCDAVTSRGQFFARVDSFLSGS